MYARYVPPSKGTGTAQPVKEPSPSPAVTMQSTTQSTTQPTTQPIAYARYIPPPRSTQKPTTQTPQRIVFNDDEPDLQDEPPTKKARISHDEPPKKSKKNKKSKKDRKPKVVASEDQLADEVEIEDNNELTTTSAVPTTHSQEKESSTDNAPTSTETTTTQEIPLKPKKEKKPKKKKSKAPTEDEQEEDGGDTPKRHKSILERAARSMQKPPEPPISETTGQQDVDMKDGYEADGNTREPPELHGLEPLPQPEPVPLDTTKPTYETLPAWLAEPIRVSPQATAPFTDFGLTPELGLGAEVAAKLSQKGYGQAFAIQTVVIPQLLPHHCKTMQGDILVSAATGSGKTLAYALPLLRDLSHSNRHLTRLRALVVLPTRELVRQAQQVFEECAGAFALDGARRRVRIATGMGSQTLQKEQATLVEREERYDPAAYAQRLRRLELTDEEEEEQEEEAGYNTEDEEKADIRRREDKIPTLPDHVVAYKSKVDILICTPGRLVEHINYTPGFSLDYVRWLVVDEADKLLSQNFQQWLDVVIPRLQKDDIPGARNHKQSNLSGVRKVILSATMTRDLDRLGGLKLRRPKLVVLEGTGMGDDLDADNSRGEHVLPDLLEEAALKVSDPNLKPLYLLDLLQSPLVLGNHISKTAQPSQSDDETSSSGSSTSSSGSDTEDSTSDSDSETSSASDSTKPTASLLPLRATTSPSSPAPNNNTQAPSVLIFTKSNETAIRLSRLLALMSPALGPPLTGTLTSTTPYARRRATLRAFAAGRSRVLVASDLVARGIDLPRLDHVINYDIPASAAAYVHRVGRTARAGLPGRAWTLFTDPEARWFWRDVAGAEGGGGAGGGSGSGSGGVIRRSGKVQRIRVTEEKNDKDAFEEKVARYEDALERLGREAGEARRRGGKGKGKGEGD